MDEADPRSEYPLGTRRPDLVRTPSGLGLEELTLEALRAGRISAGDMRATSETLRRQGAIARAASRSQLAENLERAAELTSVPDDAILEIYSALRPGRSTPEELEAWAARLESDYAAPCAAAFVREAKAAYEARELFAPDRAGTDRPPQDGEAVTSR
jgi:propanediol dehydratase small subunit